MLVKVTVYSFSYTADTNASLKKTYSNEAFFNVHHFLKKTINT